METCEAEPRKGFEKETKQTTIRKGKVIQNPDGSVDTIVVQTQKGVKMTPFLSLLPLFFFPSLFCCRSNCDYCRRVTLSSPKNAAGKRKEKENRSETNCICCGVFFAVAAISACDYRGNRVSNTKIIWPTITTSTIVCIFATALETLFVFFFSRHFLK